MERLTLRDSVSSRSEAGRLLGRRSYRIRLERLGIERLRAIARANGKKGGRPPKRDGGRHEGL
jgi:hypothetical protein